jgi:hypothetical protein
MGIHIVSLGPFCITKTAINDMNFNSPTMPFDWMFTSLTFIKEVLIDNFEQLMDKSKIRSTNPCWNKNKSYNICYNDGILRTKNIQTHYIYNNDKHDYYNFHMWNHYNLLEVEQYNKYKKYVERFQSMFSSVEMKLFIYVQYYDDAIDEVIDFNNYLFESIHNYVFVCIRCIKATHPTDIINVSYNHKNLSIFDIEIDKWDAQIPKSHLFGIKEKIFELIPEMPKGDDSA